MHITWAAILDAWDDVEVDLHARFGLDIATPGLLAARSWRWLSLRVLALLDPPYTTRLARALGLTEA